MTKRHPKLWSAKHPLVASFTAIKHMQGEQHARLFTVSYSEWYAAKIWLRTIIGDIAGVRVGNEIKLEDGLTVRSYQLQQVLDYELKADERDWMIDKDDLKMIARIRRGIWEMPTEPIVTELLTSQVRVEVRNKKVKIKRLVPTGFMSISELCKDTPVPSTVARALLRASKYEKPAYGWAFGPKDLPDVKKLIGLL